MARLRDYRKLNIFFFFFFEILLDHSVYNLFIENVAFDVWLKILYRKYSTL